MIPERPLHVAHLVHSFGTGGMEKGIATVISHASPHFKHSIICLKKSGSSRCLLPDSIKIIEMNKKEGNSLFFILRLMKVIKTLNPDIVHTRNWGGLDGVIAARLAGIQSIFHGEHGWSMDDPDGMSHKRFFFRRALNKLITAYTCVSKQMKVWLERDIKVGKSVTQIYNGVDYSLYSYGKNKELISEMGITPGTIVIGIVARLDPIKNHAALIRVFNKIHAKNSQTCLLIIGEGDERREIEKLSKKGVVFLGNRTDVPVLLNCMDLFILPSFNEGISNTILEAMASGLPVIASERGGNPELIDHNINGMLFEPTDLSSLEMLMWRYINDRNLRFSHGTKGRQRVEQLFSIQKMVRGYETAWKTVYNKGK